MKLIATLGPAGTFSEIAAQQFLSSQASHASYEISLFRTISQVFKVIGTECDYGVLPLENSLAGFVPEVLDRLLEADLKIVGELFLSVNFSYVSNVGLQDKVEKIYVQYVARSQCSEFLSSFSPDITFVSTYSNIEALHFFKSENSRNQLPVGAIVPTHSVELLTCATKIDGITNESESTTRFVVICNNTDFIENQFSLKESSKQKISLILVPEEDKPGMLEKILSPLSRRNINLLSLYSRVNTLRSSFLKTPGMLYFFMDLENSKHENVNEALSEIMIKGGVKVKLLGSY
jgi:prephenate dehydratase